MSAIPRKEDPRKPWESSKTQDWVKSAVPVVVRGRSVGRTTVTFEQFKEKTVAFLKAQLIRGKTQSSLSSPKTLETINTPLDSTITKSPKARSPKRSRNRWEEQSESELIIRDIISQSHRHPPKPCETSLSDFKPLIAAYQTTQEEKKSKLDLDKQAIKRRTLAKLKKQNLVIDPNICDEFSQAETPDLVLLQSVLKQASISTSTLKGPGGSIQRKEGSTPGRKYDGTKRLTHMRTWSQDD